MLGLRKSTPATIAAGDRVKSWVRRRFSLTAADVISVAELSCSLPGCPPIETVVTFWIDTDARHAFRVFKPLQDVIEDDLPPAWLRPELRATGDDISCC